MKTLIAILTFMTVTAHAQPLYFKTTLELKKAFEAKPTLKETDPALQLAGVVHAGQRAYDWINALNKVRATQHQKMLSYSDPSTTTSPSMEKPKVYNAELAQGLYNAIQMPADYRAVIEGSGAFPTTLTMSEQDFIALGLKVTLAYDTSVRWIMMQPDLGYYETQKIMDLRGYYFLSNMKDRDVKFANFARLPNDEQQQIHDWVVDLCINNQGFASYSYEACDTEVTQNHANLAAYYAGKIARSQELWASLFQLYDDSIRTDLTWTSADPNTLHYPFLQINDPTIATYFTTNVEDEWRLGSWHLKIEFTSQNAPDLSHLEYQAGVTPHEETNKIVMDQNEPLTEYLTQWTIRHEFGHLLGFKDCYVEYYDARLKAMVNYPIDPTNLMCSRRGHLQQQHFDVLKAAYYK